MTIIQTFKVNQAFKERVPEDGDRDRYKGPKTEISDKFKDEERN